MPPRRILSSQFPEKRSEPSTPDPTQPLDAGVYHSEHGSMHVSPVGEDLYLSNLAVPHWARGEGRGRKMMEDVTQRASHHGRPLTLHVHPTNTVARKLYQSVGFQEAEPPQEYQGPLFTNMLFMRRDP